MRDMVGLSIVLEGQKADINKRNHPQVINKITCITKPSLHPHPHPHLPASPLWNSSSTTLPPTTSSFLDQCFLCKHKLLPGKDIYMYKGDRAFCSVECRCKQMFMDEEETFKRGNNCSFSAMKLPYKTSSSSSSSSSPRSNRIGTRNRANGFAY
ncbi:FCS-Like Zinc finger 15 [Cornus florida]|uniref:FCS-Like Zinc finger 15 n=1 Tax=Cornus florida TaxID=4283 RepID=UPI002898A87E|nr:FCS-Like Zinc finger 15 [Cornus florida]